MQQLRYEANAIEPSPEFARRTIQRARKIERQRRLRFNVGFALLTLAPFGIRVLWTLIRDNYFSVGSFPFANVITYLYQMFMSSFAPYVLVAGGFILALYVVGLPHWHKPLIAQIFKKLA